MKLFALKQFLTKFSCFHQKIMFCEVRNDFAKYIYTHEVITKLFCSQAIFDKIFIFLSKNHVSQSVNQFCVWCFGIADLVGWLGALVEHWSLGVLLCVCL